MRTWPALDIQQADDDDLVQAFLIDFNLAAIEDSRFFFHTDDDRDRAAAALRVQFPAINARSIDVADEDWAARSQAALRAVTVGSLIIAPPWDAPPRSSSRIPNSVPRPLDKLRVVPSKVERRRDRDAPRLSRGESRIPAVIVIEPSMGFGTGHHATTRLCLAALQQIDLSGRSVLDVGTGSGVLAIAARRLEASGVLAIDDDPDAIAAAQANVALNRESRIAVETGDFRNLQIGQFDVVVANLTGALLVSTARRLQSLAISGGRLVLSGFIEHEEADVLSAFDGCAIESRTHSEEWVSVTLRVLRDSRA